MESKKIPGLPADPAAGETSWVCPGWFFALAVILLSARSIAGLTHFTIPALWEPIALAIMFLLVIFVYFEREFFLVVFAWFFIQMLLARILSCPDVYRWLLLLFLIEGMARKLAPCAWCAVWLLLPVYEASIFGEPLPSVLNILFLTTCVFLAFRTTVPTWSLGFKRLVLSDLGIGLALGITLAVFPPEVERGGGQFPPVIFDEAHGSSESALGNEQRPNGHQQMAQFLQRIPGQDVFFIRDFSHPIPKEGLIISILPTFPFQDWEIQKFLQHVENGGKLLLIHDHTDMDGSSSRLSPIMKALGILPGFDTIAWPTYEPPSTGFSRAMGGAIGHPGTGATLSPPAFWFPYFSSISGPHPLVWINRTSLPSEGNPSGRLNDQMSQPEIPVSRFGAAWVGAWGQKGRGQWAVLSDSSWFQNSQFVQNIDFMTRLFRLLQTPPQPRLVIIWMVVFGVLFYLFSLAYPRLGKPLLPLGLILGMALGSNFNLIMNSAPGSFSFFGNPELKSNPPSPAFSGSIANLVLPTGSACCLTSLQETTFLSNLDVFADSLFNAGWQVKMFFPDRELGGEADLWILPPSEALPHSGFMTHLKEQVRKGATLLLIGDYRQDSSRQTFRDFGFELNDSHQFLFPYDYNHLSLPDRAVTGPFSISPASPTLLPGWSDPLWSDNPTPVSGGEPLFMTPDGLAVIAVSRQEKGTVIAVGDHGFFGNGVLEVRGSIEDKIKKRFIRYLAGAFSPRRAP